MQAVRHIGGIRPLNSRGQALVSKALEDAVLPLNRSNCPRLLPSRNPIADRGRVGAYLRFSGHIKEMTTRG